MTPSYAAVLRAPYAFRTFTLAFLGRLSFGTISLSLILAFTASTGSYTQAGGLLSLLGLTLSLLTPVRAALIDRYGPRRTLPPMAGAHTLALTALAALTWRPGAPVPLLVLPIIVAGVTAPPVGVVMRTLWHGILTDKTLLPRAFSLDTVAEELAFVAGPLLAGLLAAVASPSLGIVLSAALSGAGVLGLCLCPASATRPPRHPPRRGHARRRPPAIPVAPSFAAAATGVVPGSTALLAVAFTQRHHQPAAVAWVEAAVAAGSILGGLAYGALSRSHPGHGRLAALLAALGVCLATMGLAPSVAVLTVLACATGCFVGPTLTVAYLIAGDAAPPDARTRTTAWVNTALNLGSSGGTAATGALLDLLPLPACYAIVAAPAVLVPVLLAVLPERQHSSHERDGRTHHRPMGDTLQEFWDARYAEKECVWSGEPNAVLVEETSELEPGTALDLGCGEGGDAIWLARRGWRVTAVDVSGVALERAARHAADAGVADRIRWERRDLAESFPEGAYDLVSAAFLHSPHEDMPRERILRSAAAAVAPGGVLLIIGHAGPPPWDPHAHGGVHLPTPEDVLESLDLPDDEWDVLRASEHERVQTAPDGRVMTRTDNAVKLRRRPRPAA